MYKKICTTCKKEKEIIDFHKLKTGKFGVHSKCKECSNKDKSIWQKNNKDKVNDRNKKWRELNKEKIKENRNKNTIKCIEKIKKCRKKYSVEYSENNKEKIKKYRENNKEYKKIYDKKYLENNRQKIYKRNNEWRKNNKEKVKIYNNNWVEKNPGKRNETTKKRREMDPLFKIKCNIKSRIGASFRNNGYTKKSKTFEYLGCTYEFLKKHIESQFESWMSWDNYGKYNGELNYGWDIDHIVPLSSAKNELELIKLSHYTNLKPLCSKVNRYIKKNNIK